MSSVVVLGLVIEPRRDAAGQDAAHVREAEERHGEQVAAVLLHERADRLPVVVVGDRFEHRQPQRLAVLYPEFLELLGELGTACAASGPSGPASSPQSAAAARSVSTTPIRRGPEQLVEAADAPAVGRVVPLHLPGELGEVERLAEQPEPRQPGEQVFEDVQRGLRAEHLVRLAAVGRRAVQERLAAEEGDETG